jgi:hypothetical protein
MNKASLVNVEKMHSTKLRLCGILHSTDFMPIHQRSTLLGGGLP